MYTIEQLSCITGLTTRTLRNYLKSNILQGSKDSGMWHFTEEQVSEFIHHPMVYPSIQDTRSRVTMPLSMIFWRGRTMEKMKSACCSISNWTGGKRSRRH